MHGSSAMHAMSCRPRRLLLCPAPLSRPLQDATSQVLWWVAVVCAPEASTPGPDELRGEGLPEWYPRDRNARVPWSVLESALRQAVAAGGSQQRYLEQYYQAERHKFLLTDGGSVQWGGRCPNGTAPGAR